MQCPYCLEQIKNGAVTCRYCGKAQPISAAEMKARGPRNLIILFFITAAAFLVLLLKG